MPRQVDKQIHKQMVRNYLKQDQVVTTNGILIINLAYLILLVVTYQVQLVQVQVMLYLLLVQFM